MNNPRIKLGVVNTPENTHALLMPIDLFMASIRRLSRDINDNWPQPVDFLIHVDGRGLLWGPISRVVLKDRPDSTLLFWSNPLSLPTENSIIAIMTAQVWMSEVVPMIECNYSTNSEPVLCLVVGKEGWNVLGWSEPSPFKAPNGVQH